MPKTKSLYRDRDTGEDKFFSGIGQSTSKKQRWYGKKKEKQYGFYNPTPGERGREYIKDPDQAEQVYASLASAFDTALGDYRRRAGRLRSQIDVSKGGLFDRLLDSSDVRII